MTSMIPWFWLLACTDTKDTTEQLEPSIPVADIFVDTIGDPIPSLNVSLSDSYENGATVMTHAFTPKGGLGPTFNADSCASCHQMPVPGGSAPRYRDFWLIQTERWDGAMVSAGTNGESPVRNHYATAPTHHVPPSPDATTYARRNAPPMFGVGLFAFVADEDILAMADPEDENGDGISGRANYEKGEVGRFGYKSQAASLESFNRGAIFNQMGITSDPLFYEFIELQDTGKNSYLQSLPNFSFINTAEAQVAALDEPTVDDDLAPDPEISNDDQRDLLIFSTYIGVPEFTPLDDRSPSSKQGEQAFVEVGCANCHTPIIPSAIGGLPAYTDLLLHDMGPELADGISAGFAQGSEFRTQPLWGVGLHPPYLHDGRADTLTEAIEWHGGEAQTSVDRWLALSDESKQSILDFLHDLGGTPNKQNFLNRSEFTVPEHGELGGPRRELSSEDTVRFAKGLELFDGNFVEEAGLNPTFNADSCRACHQDPVIGGAGGIDVNVLRLDWINDQGDRTSMDSSAILLRSTLPGVLPLELWDWNQADTLIIESRQPPSLLGIGEMENISNETILAHADPEDLDGDGISGRPHILTNGQLGRFGWKAQIPSVRDFVADALLVEVGVTVHPSLSDFTVENDFDSCADPELVDEDVDALEFFVYELGAPTSTTDSVNEIFVQAGCAGCHIPSMDGVPLYSDLLLHDMGYEPSTVVDHDLNAAPSEFRTAPLWGIRDTAPYMHNGATESLHDAILYHGGEANNSVIHYESLSEEERQSLLDFLKDL